MTSSRLRWRSVLILWLRQSRQSQGLAHKYDLLPFPVEDIEWGISTCFKAWLKGRGGDGSIKVKQVIERIEHLLVTNEFRDRVMDLRDGDTKTVRNLLAYRKVANAPNLHIWRIRHF